MTQTPSPLSTAKLLIDGIQTDVLVETTRNPDVVLVSYRQGEQLHQRMVAKADLLTD